jgi:hypothetical protein
VTGRIVAITNIGRKDAMTPEEQITKMKKAITQAIKVMGDRFGSTETDVARAIEELKASMLPAQAVAAAGALKSE